VLNLAATTDKLQVITGQAVTVDVHASFIDGTAADPIASKGTTSGRQNTAISTATTTDIVAAPAASILRNVKTLIIRNKSASTTVDVTVQFNQNATLIELVKTTLAPQATLFYSEMTNFMVFGPTATTTLLKVLSADDAGGIDSTTAQPWFPTAGAVTVAADTTYLMEGHLGTSRSAGAVSHVTQLLFGGTATLTSIEYVADVNTGDTVSTVATARINPRVATATTCKAASVAPTEQIAVQLWGIVRISAAGTFIPQFKYSAAPGGATTVLKNSYFRMTPLGPAAFTTQGVWA
jgi:hypothetical protein